ncbi:MAG: efflux RND transporter periplasmic adaptor subunit [Pseudomonadota bacterium]
MTTKSATSKRKYLIALIILVAAIGGAVFISKNPPEQRRGPPSKAPQMSVEVMTVQPQQYQIELDSFGTVSPRTQSALVAQVSGQIKAISDNFRDGGFFKAGEVLVQLDDRDYKADLDIARATLSEAKQLLLEEQARADIASEDWNRYQSLPEEQRLNKADTPNILLLRGPQVEAAKARVLSAKAQLNKAALAVERSTIVAPYDGRILSKSVDVGQVVGANTALANIFAVDFVEIRLPLNNSDLALIDLPEEFRSSSVNTTTANQAEVSFSSELNAEQTWRGRVVRTESAIDTASQQLYVVAQIDDPYGLAQSKAASVKIGQYVKARVKGKLLNNAVVIPNSAIYQGSYVYVVEEGILKRREIDTRWQNEADAVIASGLEFGDKLVTTALGQISSGTPVSVSSQGTGLSQRSGFANVSPERLKRLQQRAKEQGVTVEQLMAERRKRRAQNSTEDKS